MTERIVHVYRTVEMAEYVVDDDGIYEDDVDMLRDVCEAAKGGLLDFAPTEAEFVVMTWNEDSAMTVRAAFPEGSAEARRPAGRETEFCPRCLEPQFRTGRTATCRNGHEGLPGIGQSERAQKLEARREARELDAPAPAPPPAPRKRTARRKPRERNSR